MYPPPITVRTPEASYPIYIHEGALGQLRQWLDTAAIAGKLAIISNPDLAVLYGQRLAAELGATLVLMPEGEQAKNLDTVRELYSQLIGAGLDRRGAVIALGGGVIGDTAGFVAATYLRGIAFVQAPTSLLAMVDASVGGKVGVDIPEGKNLIGAFKQPACVVIDPLVLDSLPTAEWRAGAAEVLKAGLIRAPQLLDAALYQQGQRGAAFLRQAVQIKADVVEADPYEANIRAYLNLGHTFGHAIERVSGYTWRHGDAVAVGLVAAARLSARLGYCPEALAAEVETVVAAVGLPTRCPHYDPAAIYAAMATDKKRVDSDIRFVLLRAAGEPFLQGGIAKDEVLAVLAGLC
jgi:3-dehydroquinate synthase